MSPALLFYRLLLRPLRREPVRTLLTALSVALGVAVVLAIELAGGAAVGSFRSSLESVTGNADLEVTATGGVDASLLARIVTLPYPLKARPRIEDFAQIAATGRTVPLIGVDMVSDFPGAGSANDGWSFEQSDSIWTSEELGFRTGDNVRLWVNDRAWDCVVRGVLPKHSGEAVVMDLAPASEILNRGARLDRILIEVPHDRPLEQWIDLLRRALPAGVEVAPQGARTEESRKMLGAFRWNLRVLSYIALVVGAFLIYNTISVSVARRRAEIGIVRALGATRGQVLAAFIAEGACFGLAGGAAGIALGRLMAAGAVKLVAATVDSLYVSSRPGPISLTATLCVAGLAVGLLVAVGSAFAPAWEASRVSPMDAMARGLREHTARIHRLRGLAISAVLAMLGWLASRCEPVGGKPVFGYFSALLLIGAATLAMPALVSLLTNASSGLTGRLMCRVLGVEALLAARALAGSLRRTSVLVGALSTAVAMTAAVGIMVGSFRETVALWLGDRMQADLYLLPAVPAGAGRHSTISPSATGRLKALPEISSVDPFRSYDIRYDGLPSVLGGNDSRVAARFGRRAFLSGSDSRRVYAEMTRGDNAIISESFANKHRIRSGDALALSLAGRRVQLRVLDIFYDYSSERGFVIVDRGTLLKYLPDPAPESIAVYLKPGVSLTQGRGAVEREVADLRIHTISSRTLREQGMKIFDRTFAITYALEAVAVLVAVMGAAGALLALVIDRRREFGLLRFLGGASAQLQRIVVFEAGLLGLFSLAAGLVLGVVLSLLLIFVINKQSFGWTIQFHWPVLTLAGGLAVVFLATVLAGIYPARTAARLNPLEVIHEE